MHRLTISLPEELAVLVSHEAERQGTSVSDVVRRAVAVALGQPDAPSPLPFAALGRSGHRTTARDAEEILAQEWAGARDR